MQIGEMIGPARSVEVVAVANIGGGFGVFIGKEIRRHGVEFVVSTFTFGEKTWHNGRYTPDYRRALDVFINRIDSESCVTQP
jgi:hypothetical protein